MESGYGQREKEGLYPYRVFGTGRLSSFLVTLRLHEFDYLCSGAIQGFKVTFNVNWFKSNCWNNTYVELEYEFQPPNEEPQFVKNYFYVSPNRGVLFKVTPKLIITSLNLNTYSPSVRRCYFNSERQLRFYKQYTQKNCETECLANLTLAECGCVKFAMPSRIHFFLSFFLMIRNKMDEKNKTHFQELKEIKFVAQPKWNAAWERMAWYFGRKLQICAIVCQRVRHSRMMSKQLRPIMI